MKSLTKFPSNFPAQCHLLSTPDPDAQSRRIVLASWAATKWILIPKHLYLQLPPPSLSAIFREVLGGLLHGIKSCVKLQATSEQGLL